MNLRSIKPLETLGREAGSERTLNWECLHGREPIGEASAPALDGLPLRQNSEFLRTAYVPPATRCDGRMRCALEVCAKHCSSRTATVAASALSREDGSVDHCSSSRSWKISVAAHDLILPRMSLEGASHRGDANEHKPLCWLSSGGSSIRHDTSKRCLNFQPRQLPKRRCSRSLSLLLRCTPPGTTRYRLTSLGQSIRSRLTISTNALLCRTRDQQLIAMVAAASSHDLRLPDQLLTN